MVSSLHIMREPDRQDFLKIPYSRTADIDLCCCLLTWYSMAGIAGSRESIPF
jgi:hypothetical protein